jgi:hypothetical protein
VSSSYARASKYLFLAAVVAGLGGLAAYSRNWPGSVVALYVSVFLWMFGSVAWSLAKGQHWGWGLLGFSLVGIAVIAWLPNKIESDLSRKGNLDLRTLDPETAKLTWPCPKCGNDNPNTTYKCQSCGYSVV